MPAGDQQGNNLIAALRAADRGLLLGDASEIEAAAGDVLYEPGDDVRHVYFPRGPALVSFLVVFDDGETVETALIGREGAVGGIVSRGRLPAFARTIVQHPGALYRLETARLEQAKDASPAIRSLFARYADCVMAQMFQAVACSARHSIEARTARWLLAAQDRTGGPRIPITQERLAQVLGVGRSYVGRVVGSLRAAGALLPRHGALEIRDTARLRAASCDCDDAVRAHFERVLAGVYPEAE
jgi:CRP-like cAMP-binding protein